MASAGYGVASHDIDWTRTGSAAPAFGYAGLGLGIKHPDLASSDSASDSTSFVAQSEPPAPSPEKKKQWGIGARRPSPLSVPLSPDKWYAKSSSKNASPLPSPRTHTEQSAAGQPYTTQANPLHAAKGAAASTAGLTPNQIRQREWYASLGASAAAPESLAASEPAAPSTPTALDSAREAHSQPRAKKSHARRHVAAEPAPAVSEPVSEAQASEKAKEKKGRRHKNERSYSEYDWNGVGDGFGYAQLGARPVTPERRAGQSEWDGLVQGPGGRNSPEKPKENFVRRAFKSIGCLGGDDTVPAAKRPAPRPAVTTDKRSSVADRVASLRTKLTTGRKGAQKQGTEEAPGSYQWGPQYYSYAETI